MANLTLTKPTVFIMLGVPGAGKTYFARQFADELGIAHISEDRLRFELFDAPTYSQEENNVIRSIGNYMLDEFLAHGGSLIYDGDNNQKKIRHEIREIAKRNQAHTLVVWVQTDHDTSIDRATNKDRRKPDDKYTHEMTEGVFEHLANTLKRPDNEDYVVISGKHLFKTQFLTVLRKLKAMDMLELRKDIQAERTMTAETNSQRPRMNVERRNVNTRANISG